MVQLLRLLMSLILLATTAVVAAAQKPNVLIILVDDLGLHDIGVEGSTYYQTPNIDQFAKESMRFTTGYANCQVCSPSRASLQLGQFPARHGITDWIGAATGMNFNRGDALLPAEYGRSLPHQDVTIAESFRDSGYATFFAGKWHLGGPGSLPTDHGYEINKGGHDKGSPPGGFFSPYNNPLLEDGPPGESLTLRLADETSRFIHENSQEHSKPFFAMLSFYAVHAPLETTPALWEKYRLLAPPRQGDRFLIDRTLPVRQVQDHPVYAGMMETLDTAVGNVLATLQSTGLADSTIVFFTGDNGGVSSGDAYATSNLPLRGGKGRQWEGGIREPFYLRFPRLTPNGGTCDVPVTAADIYPTVLELCNLPLVPQQHADGRSLARLLMGHPDEAFDNRPLIWHYPHYGNQGGEPSSVIRQGDHKLIHYHTDRHDELYNVVHDLGEKHDLANEEPERVAAMRGVLLNYLQSVHAKFPEPDPRFDPLEDRQRWKKVLDKVKPKLERDHATFLDPQWQPEPTWWGSKHDRHRIPSTAPSPVRPIDSAK